VVQVRPISSSLFDYPNIRLAIQIIPIKQLWDSMCIRFWAARTQELLVQNRLLTMMHVYTRGLCCSVHPEALWWIVSRLISYRIPKGFIASDGILNGIWPKGPGPIRENITNYESHYRPTTFSGRFNFLSPCSSTFAQHCVLRHKDYSSF
jgi:hypothetical protein